MIGWTDEELERIGHARVVHVAPRRPDGALGNRVTVQAVAADGAVYIRSVHGPGASWFRTLREAGEGHIQAGGVSRDVVVEPAVDPGLDLDSAYRETYGGGRPLRAITGPLAVRATLKITPS